MSVVPTDKRGLIGRVRRVFTRLREFIYGARVELAAPTLLCQAVKNKTKYDELWRQAPESLDRLELTYLEAQKYLVPEDAEMCQARIVDGVERAALLLNGHRGPAAADALLARRHAEVSEFLQRSGTRRLMREYSRGLYWGVAASVLVLVAIAAAALGILALFGTLAHNSNQVSNSVEPLSHALICIGGGATGSTLSVLLRLRNNADRLDYRASGKRASVVRIVLGWFFAAAVLVLVKGGILTMLQEPTVGAGSAATFEQAAKAWFFWAGIGVLAGFNERWARDLVTRQPDDAGSSAAGKGQAPSPLPPAGEPATPAPVTPPGPKPQADEPAVPAAIQPAPTPVSPAPSASLLDSQQAPPEVAAPASPAGL